VIQINTSVGSLLAGSWQFWHNRETITLVVVGRTSDLEYTVDDCKRFEITKRDIPTQRTGAFTGHDLVWIIPTGKVPGFVVPKVADRVRDAAGTEYTVLDTFRNGWQNWDRLVTRNLVFAYDLRDTISHWRAANTQDTGGGRVAGTYTEVKSGVPAKVQEVTSAREDLLGKRQARRTYEIHCGQMIDWRPTDQIRDQNGLVYQITAGSAPGTIDTADIVLTVERIL
jgi:hypothetical protein